MKGPFSFYYTLHLFVCVCACAYACVYVCVHIHPHTAQYKLGGQMTTWGWGVVLSSHREGSSYQTQAVSLAASSFTPWAILLALKDLLIIGTALKRPRRAAGRIQWESVIFKHEKDWVFLCSIITFVKVPSGEKFKYILKVWFCKRWWPERRSIGPILVLTYVGLPGTGVLWPVFSKCWWNRTHTMYLYNRQFQSHFTGPIASSSLSQNQRKATGCP